MGVIWDESWDDDESWDEGMGMEKVLLSVVKKIDNRTNFKTLCGKADSGLVVTNREYRLIFRRCVGGGKRRNKLKFKIKGWSTIILLIDPISPFPQTNNTIPYKT